MEGRGGALEQTGVAVKSRISHLWKMWSMSVGLGVSILGDL